MMQKLIILLLVTTPLLWSCEKQKLEEMHDQIREIAWNNIPENGKEIITTKLEDAPVHETTLWEEPAYQVIFATSDTVYGSIYCYIAKDGWDFIGFGDITVNQTPSE